MRVRVVTGGMLMVTGVLIAVAGLVGASEQPDPGSVRLGVALICVPTVALGVWLWRGGRRQPTGGRGRGKRIAAGVGGALLVAIAPVAAADGEAAVAASLVLFATLAFGYVVVARDSAADDVVVAMLKLPTGPERGLRVVVPRSKQLVYVWGMGIAGVCLAVLAPAARSDGGGTWVLLAVIAVVLLVAFPFLAVRTRGPAGIGVSASGVSFTQRERTVLVPWGHLERIETFRMRTGRYGGHVHMVGLYVDDHHNIVGLSDTMRRLARVNRAVGPDLSWPVTMFDLDGEQIVALVRRYHEDPERRRELASATEAPSV